MTRVRPFRLAALVAAVVSFCAGERFARAGLPDAAAATDLRASLIVVVGAAGEKSYGDIFADEAKSWREAAKQSEVRFELIGGDVASSAAKTDKTRMEAVLAAEAKRPSEAGPLWLILVGHGTFDGRTAAFNLNGPDVTSVELAAWLEPIERPTIVVNTTAAAAPFLTELSAPGRVVITATKSGQERNYARFGRYFAARIIDPAADLDKDDQTSVFEAFLAAARDTAEFYRSEGRIATEHALLDDDGDGRGVRVEFFERDKLVKRPQGEAAADGEAARRFHLKRSTTERRLSPEQLAQRDKLEAELAKLRGRKAELSDQAYFAELERVLVALARLQAEETKPISAGK